MNKFDVVVFVPELFRGAGGIQSFSRSLVAVCDQIGERPVPVISQNDRVRDCPADFLKDREVHAAGLLPQHLRPLGVVLSSFQYRRCRIVSTHVHFTPWLRWLKRMSGAEYLTVAHGIDVWNKWNSGLRSGLDEASRVLAVSEHTRQAVLKQRRGNADDVIVFPNTVDAIRFVPGPASPETLAKLQIPLDSRVILTVGRVSRQDELKGYRLVLEAVPELVRRYPNLIWLLAGSGNLLAELNEQARSLGVERNCRFAGFVSDKDLPDLYRAANVFALPSRKEGFGIAFLEAIASGIPVIAGNQDGSVDALANGKFGQLINPTSRDELVTAVSRVFDGKLPPHLVDGARLREQCLELFGPDRFEARFRECLHSLGWIPS